MSKAPKTGNGARHSPALSVVMPVHNALPYLDEAIKSILGQDFTDFEFVILDDGSTDGSSERLRFWAGEDRRIRLISAESKLGPALSSDRVARAASAPIVARMDADDLCAPNRLSEQLDLLRKQPNAGVVASLSDVIDSDGRVIRKAEPWRLARRSAMVPFAHGAIMYRKSVFDQVGGYRLDCDYWEDQDLLTRMSAVTEILVIPKPLYRVRQSATSTRSSSEQPQRIERALDEMYRTLEGRDEGSDEPGGEPTREGKIDPRVFVSRGSVTLWSGGRPKLLRRLLEQGKLDWSRRSLLALVWAIWASASPATLRVFLRLLAAARNTLGRTRLDPGAPVRWSPPRAPGGRGEPAPRW